MDYGNLQSLIDQMDDDQQRRFHHALIRQMVHDLEGRLPPEDRDNGERACLNFAYDWLQLPGQETAAAAETFAGFEAIDGGARYFDYDGAFLTPLLMLNAVDLWVVARTARGQASEPQLRHQWQIETARAILSGGDAPAFDSISEAVPLADAESAYLAGEFEALVEFMTDAQKTQYWRLMIDEILHLAELHTPPEAQDRGWRICVAAVRDWLVEPTPEREKAVFDAHMAYLRVNSTDHTHPANNATHAVRLAQQADLSRRVRDSATYLRWSATYRVQPHTAQMARGLRQRQLDAAWAIMQGRAIPMRPIYS